MHSQRSVSGRDLFPPVSGCAKTAKHWAYLRGRRLTHGISPGRKLANEHVRLHGFFSNSVGLNFISREWKLCCAGKLGTPYCIFYDFLSLNATDIGAVKISFVKLALAFIVYSRRLLTSNKWARNRFRLTYLVLFILYSLRFTLSFYFVRCTTEQLLLLLFYKRLCVCTKRYSSKKSLYFCMHLNCIVHAKLWVINRIDYSFSSV